MGWEILQTGFCKTFNEWKRTSLVIKILLSLSKSFFSVWRTQIGLKEGVWGHKELTRLFLHAEHHLPAVYKWNHKTHMKIRIGN